MRSILVTILLPFVGLLSGCGGGGGGGTASNASAAPPYVGLFDATSQEISTLAAHSLNSTTGAVASAGGSLDRANNKATLGNLTGTIDGSRTSVALASGGSIAIQHGSTTFVAAYTAQPTGADPTFGVVGVPTLTADIPSASGTYVGTSSLQIIDGTSVFDLTGASSIVANFGTGIVSISLTALDGTKTDGVSAPVVVNNVGTLNISGASIAGNSFSGGSASLSSTQLSASLSGGQTVTTSGGFFGPAASEVGGVLSVDDTAGVGSLLLQGIFVGN